MMSSLRDQRGSLLLSSLMNTDSYQKISFSVWFLEKTWFIFSLDGQNPEQTFIWGQILIQFDSNAFICICPRETITGIKSSTHQLTQRTTHTHTHTHTHTKKTKSSFIVWFHHHVWAVTLFKDSCPVMYSHCRNVTKHIYSSTGLKAVPSSTPLNLRVIYYFMFPQDLPAVVCFWVKRP